MMNNRFVILLISGLLSWSSGLWANNQGEQFAKALQAQVDGKTSQAIDLYEEIVEEGHRSAQLHNNLGLAYAKQKQLGEAILHFERALKISPSHTAAQKNLQAAKQRIKEPIPPIQSLFFVRWWNNTASLFSSTAWAVLFLILLSGGAAAMTAWRWYAQTNYRQWAIGLWAFSVLPLIWGYQQKSIETDDRQAIVIKKTVGLRQEANLRSDEIELIPEGTKLQVVRKEGSWVYVQLPNHLVGWMPQQMIEKI